MVLERSPQGAHRLDFWRPHTGIGGKFGVLTQVVSSRLEPVSFPLYQGPFFFFPSAVSMAMHQSLV